MTPAPFPKRMLAFAIDLLLINLGYGLLWIAALAGLSLGLHQMDRSLPSQGLVLSLARYVVAAWSLLFIGYFWYFTAAGGQTPGKRVARIRVVTTTAAAVPWLPAFWRAIVLHMSLPFFVIYLLAAVTPQRRAIHDYLASTRVILTTTLAALLLLAPVTSVPAVVIDQLLAVVNGKTIALSDLVRQRLLFAPTLPPDQLLEHMIDHVIVLDEASRFELAPPDPAQLRSAIGELERSFDSAEQWNAVLARLGLSPNELDQLVAERLQVESFLVQRVDLFVFVSPAEVEAVYEEEADRFTGQPPDAAERTIEQELIRRKTAERRRDYVAQLRSRATIRQLAEVPDGLPARP
jgi:uncharacterized RDD family membrane protein YckC